jgi:hypothetical protein
MGSDQSDEVWEAALNPPAGKQVAMIAEPVRRPRGIGRRSAVGWWRRDEAMGQVRSYTEADSRFKSRILLHTCINREQTATASP